jgi:hypothetical protein
VLTISAEPLDLPAQALKFLLRLRQMAGKARKLTTYTKSLATIFNRTTNTIRNWRDYLLDAGYIHWLTDRRTGMTTIMITELVEPPSRRARIELQRQIDALPLPLPWQPQKPVVMGPDPKPWSKFPMISKFCMGGAKLIEDIKTSKKEEPEERTLFLEKWDLTGRNQPML